MQWIEQWLAGSPNGLNPGLFLLLLVCGVGLPFPEELLFLTAGYLGRESGANPWLLMCSGLCGVIVGDQIPFLIGCKFGMRLQTHPLLMRFLPERHLARIRAFFQKRGAQAVLLARFIPGFRTPTFLVAGSMGTPWLVFVSWDLAGALITCPVSIGLAFIFGRPVRDWFLQYHHLAIAIVILIVLIAVLIWLRTHRLAPRPDDA